MRLCEQVINDYRYLRLSLKVHPLAFIRPKLDGPNAILHENLGEVRNCRNIYVAGLVLVLKRSGSAKSVIFLTLEDETGVANIIVWPKFFERYRRIILGGRLSRIYGKLQSQSGVIHIAASHIEDMILHLEALELDRPKNMSPDDIREKMKSSRLGEKINKGPQQSEILPMVDRHQSAIRKVMPKGRNFHYVLKYTTCLQVISELFRRGE